MYTIYLYTFTSIFIISLLSFVGALTLLVSKEKIIKLTTFLVSLSAGTLLGGASLHLLPEAIKNNDQSNNVWTLFLVGILIFFILEKIIRWRHCHIPTSHDHPHPLGTMNLVGDGLHNFLDGMVIAGSFLISPTLGVATTVAVMAHEIPQEIADFGVLIHAGYSRKKALIFNFFIALMSFLGAIITFALSSKINNLADALMPIAAGGFIYIATADLIPELKKENRIAHSLLQLTAIILGIGIMYLLK